MTTHQQETATSGHGVWWLSVGGILAVTGMVAALVWVLEGQVQQAEVLRAQWKGAPVSGQPLSAAASESTSGASKGAVNGSNNGIMAASFDRP